MADHLKGDLHYKENIREKIDKLKALKAERKSLYTDLNHNTFDILNQNIKECLESTENTLKRYEDIFRDRE